MKNKFLLLSAALILASTPMFAGSVSTEVKAQNVLLAPATKQISLQDVQVYMYSYGIRIVSMVYIDGCENVYATDVYGKGYIVYVTNGIITGHEEEM